MHIIGQRKSPRSKITRTIEVNILALAYKSKRVSQNAGFFSDPVFSCSFLTFFKNWKFEVKMHFYVLVCRMGVLDGAWAYMIILYWYRVMTYFLEIVHIIEHIIIMSSYIYLDIFVNVPVANYTLNCNVVSFVNLISWKYIRNFL